MEKVTANQQFYYVRSPKLTRHIQLDSTIINGRRQSPKETLQNIFKIYLDSYVISIRLKICLLLECFGLQVDKSNINLHINMAPYIDQQEFRQEVVSNT